MKRMLTLLIAVLICLFTAACGGRGQTDTVPGFPAPFPAVEEKLNIVPADSGTLSYAYYDNGLISMELPAGWRMDIAPTSYTYYSFRAYDPQRPDLQIVSALKFEGAVKSWEARDWFTRYYGADNIFARTAILDDNTAECFFNAFNSVCDLNNSDSFAYPYIYNFSVIENFGPTIFGGDLLRASYMNSDGAAVEGLFTATTVDFGPYMVNSDIMDLYSQQLDLGLKNVYSVFFYTAPSGEFIQWQGVLDHCLSTLKYSDAFMSGYAQEQKQVMENFNSVRSTGSEISDMISSSWQNRSSSYDVISQKQSDATLGYERVYDTETNEIYKAYNGFSDDYSGQRYKPVTDDMYSAPVAGYIER